MILINITYSIFVDNLCNFYIFESFFTSDCTAADSQFHDETIYMENLENLKSKMEYQQIPEIYEAGVSLFRDKVNMVSLKSLYFHIIITLIRNI